MNLPDKSDMYKVAYFPSTGNNKKPVYRFMYWNSEKKTWHHVKTGYEKFWARTDVFSKPIHWWKPVQENDDMFGLKFEGWIDSATKGAGDGPKYERLFR